MHRKESSYWTNKILIDANNSKRLLKSLNTLLLCDDFHKVIRSVLTTERIPNFFRCKIEAVRANTVHNDQPTFYRLATTTFSQFKACSIYDIRRIIQQFPVKSCSLDPIPAGIFTCICMCIGLYNVHIEL